LPTVFDAGFGPCSTYAEDSKNSNYEFCEDDGACSPCCECIPQCRHVYCTVCPPDTAKAGSGSSECVACPDDSSSEEGSAKCQCDPGFGGGVFEAVQRSDETKPEISYQGVNVQEGVLLGPEDAADIPEISFPDAKVKRHCFIELLFSDDA
jgi:hypothetical protein